VTEQCVGFSSLIIVSNSVDSAVFGGYIHEETPIDDEVIREIDIGIDQVLLAFLLGLLLVEKL